MRIGMVLDHVFPPDIRVEKEARALVAAGHTVHLLAYAQPGKTMPGEDSWEGVIVRRIPGLVGWPKKLNLLRFYANFHDPYWDEAIARFAADYQIAVLHVHDLRMAGTAQAVGRRLGIPVVVDLHENFPMLLQTVEGRAQGLASQVRRWINHQTITSLRRWVGYERRAVMQADHILVVVDESRDRIMAAYGIPPHKITTILNVEDQDYFAHMTVDSEVLARYSGLFVVAYVGGGGAHRGLETAVRAVTELNGIPDIRLVLIGVRDEAEQNRLKAIARVGGAADQVEIIGWQPFDKVPSYIAASQVCLVPHRKNPHTDSTIPHKLFQYMLMRKPVIVSSCRPLQRIVEETGSGLVFESENAADLAAQIRVLYDNPAHRQQLGENGFQAVQSRYNWASEAQKLVTFYNMLA